MAAELINLRRARKRMEREAAAGKAAENRALSGRTKAEKKLETLERAKAERQFEQGRRERDER